MAPIDQLKVKLSSIANAIRGRTGTTDKFSLDQITQEIESMSIGDDGETFILVDNNGNEIPAVLTDEEVVLTATANDIRLGSIAVTDAGIIEGTKEIPVYHSTEGFKVIPNGSKFLIPIPDHAYTKLQAIICSYNTSMTNSVAAQKVAIGDSVYPVQSTEVESTITVNTETGYIDFGITNTSGKICLIRYFTFKEIY